MCRILSKFDTARVETRSNSYAERRSEQKNTSRSKKRKRAIRSACTLPGAMEKATIFVGPSKPRERPEVFQPSKVACQRWLSQAGFAVHSVDAKGLLGTRALSAIPSGQKVLIFLGHGGWDGPFLGAYDSLVYAQGSTDPQMSRTWNELVQTLRTNVLPGGLVVVIACHSAGSTAREEDNPLRPLAPTWIQQVSLWVPVFTVGVRGQTSAADPALATQTLSFAVRGKPKMPLATAFGPGWSPVREWRGWVTHARQWRVPPT